MTTKETFEVFRVLRAAYPGAEAFQNDEDLKNQICLWQRKFADTPVQAVLSAIDRHIDRSAFPPKICEIRELIRKKALPVNAEGLLWDRMQAIASRVYDLRQEFSYTIIEDDGKTQGQHAREKAYGIFESMPPALKAYVPTYGELLRKSDRLAEAGERSLGCEERAFRECVSAYLEYADDRELLALTQKDLPLLTGAG